MARKKLKICQICAVDFTLKHFLLPLINKLEETFDVTTLCSRGDYIKEFVKNGHKYQEIKINRNLNIFHHLISIKSMRKIFIKEQFDVIHTHSPIASLIARIACLFLREKPILIYSAHGFYFHDEMNKFYKFLHIALEKILSLNTDYIFTQSYEDYKNAIKYKFVNKENIFHISNGVNVKKFLDSSINFKKEIYEFKKKFNTDNKIVIGFIGRLSKEKGFNEYLISAEYLLNKYNKVFFLVIGDFKHGKKTSVINKKLNNLKQNKNFLYLGYQENIPLYLNIIDIFCLPSYREGMPRSIIEAMISKKAIVASNIRGCREEITNNHTGVLIPTKNSEELIKALEKLISNNKLIYYFGSNAQNYAVKNFNETDVVNKQIKIINKVTHKTL